MKNQLFFKYLAGIPLWIVLPVLLLIGNLLAGFNGLYGQDSFEYLRYSRALHHYLSAGVLPGPFHWPLFYPLSGALLSFILPDVLALQVISIASYGLLIFFLQKITGRLFPEKKKETRLFILLFFALSPFVLRYSSTVMSDPMAMFLVGAFFYSFFRYTADGENKNFLLLILWACAAMNTRYASFVVIIIPLTIAIISFFKRLQPGIFVLSLLLAVMVLLPWMYLQYRSGSSLFDQVIIPGWSFSHILHRSFSSSDGMLSYVLPNICFVFSDLLYPGFIFAGILFLVTLRKSNLKETFLLTTGITMVCYALFLAGLPYQNDRLLLLNFPLVILVYTGSFLRVNKVLPGWINSSRRFVLILLIVIIQITLAWRAFVPFYRNSLMTREIANHMKLYPGKTIYTFNIDMALDAYGVKNKTINLWSNRILKFDSGSLVLFNYTGSFIQWKGMNPMLNWESLNRDHQLNLIEKLPGKWNLYEIGN